MTNSSYLQHTATQKPLTTALEGGDRSLESAFTGNTPLD